MKVNPAEIAADFESAIQIGVNSVWPNIINLSSEDIIWGDLSIGKSKIMDFGTNYKDKEDEIGKSLRLFFGLSLLSTEEVVYCFIQDVMSKLPPNDLKVAEFRDFVLEYYVSPDSHSNKFMNRKKLEHEKENIFFFAQFDDYAIKIKLLTTRFSLNSNPPWQGPTSNPLPLYKI